MPLSSLCPIALKEKDKLLDIQTTLNIKKDKARDILDILNQEEEKAREDADKAKQDEKDRYSSFSACF